MAFVTSWVEISCPVGGCAYQARIRVGAEGTGVGHADWVGTLRVEHPGHPTDHTALVVGEAPPRF